MNDDGHPDWTIDLHSGTATVDNQTGPTTTSQPEVSETPSADAGAGQVPATPTAAAPTPPATQDEPSIPKYRFDAVNQRAAEALRENQELKDLLRQSLTTRQPPPAQPAAATPVLSDEEQQYAAETEEVRQEFFKRFPEFAKMADQLESTLKRLEQLAPVAEILPELQARENRYWMGTAKTMLQQVHQQVSTAFMDGKPLTPGSPTATQVAERFSAWTMSDPARVDRYEANDPTLIHDFVTYFGDTFVTPWRGAAPPAPAGPPTAQQQTVARVARLPVAGPSAVPPPVTPKRRDFSNEEEVHEDAWAVVQNMRSAMGQ